ncbi:MAG: hypothetical protein HY290_03125 [Planctomycetia bacterium]|nr:hypothetical protein [Planctomycetia bacterium]
MSTVQRLLARITALRVRWNARRRRTVAVPWREPVTSVAVRESDNADERIFRDDVPDPSGVAEDSDPIPLKNRITNFLVLCLAVSPLVLFMVLVCASESPNKALSRGAPTIPEFRKATLCLSRTGRGELAWARLYDPKVPRVRASRGIEASTRAGAVKFVDQVDGTAVQIEWNFVGSPSRSYDSYNFKIIGPSGVQILKTVNVTALQMNLLMDRDVVVTIREMDF